jgi:prolyl oligopeptidase
MFEYLRLKWLSPRNGAMAVATAGLCALAMAAGPPTAPIREVTDTIHGVTVKDPYRYLENVKAPEVQAWMNAQGEFARETLDRIELRAPLEERIAELTKARGDAISNIVRMPGDHVYYLKRPKGERQYKLFVRVGLAGRERVLVDPEVDARRTGVPHAINYFVPSWDNKHVAYGISAGGSEDASLYILNVESGKQVGQPIARVHEGLVSWLPDSRSLTFNQLKVPSLDEPDTETYMDTRVMWLMVGEPETAAKAVFGPTVSKSLGLARLDVGGILFVPGSPWMIARTTDTTQKEGSLFVAPVADIGNPEIGWKKISTFTDKIIEIALEGSNLYFLTYADAPRRRVLKLDLRNPDLRNAVEVAVPPKDTVLEAFELTKDSLVAAIRDGTEIGLRRYRPGDVSGEAIALPVKGAAYVHDDPAHAYSDVLYSINGWTSLPQTLRLTGKRSIDAGLRKNPPLPKLPTVEIANVTVPSHDGVMVPMTLLYRKGLKRDGNNPALLTGYATYGLSQTAGFSAPGMAFIERGGVLAFVNARGSGVYGEEWRRAGFKATKSNTWRDGIACAKYLIAEGYASPKTLGILGGSAGGIFVGRATTSAPELFTAAIFVVGVLDTVRAEESANGITNVSEFGSVKDPKEFAALLDMSTYHNIKDNTAYPAVLLVHGINDPRVDVWQSAKTAARLQAASNSGKPVLLRLDMQAGHGIGSTIDQANAQSADIYSFLLWQAGKTRLKQ